MGPSGNWAAEIMSRFDHVIESSKAGVSKPDPRIYEMMLETLGIAPGEAIYVDDLGVNLKPAVAMGMDVVKVPFEGYEIAIDELAQKNGAYTYMIHLRQIALVARNLANAQADLEAVFGIEPCHVDPEGG